MTHQFDVKPNRRSGSLLASTIILFVGSIAAAILFGSVGESISIGLIAFGVGITLIVVFLISATLWAVPSLGESISWIITRHRQDELNYSPGPRETKQHDSRFGTRTPPTVDEVREIKAGSNNWVPAAGRKDKSPPGQQRP
ncbi:MAG: hypothetical protein KDA69_02405 [Planctomycetaceae bacterium]|nr:hypothetical protein [Planctomycetaceae bacterium]MCA9043140.1 hypothetical protein [Planctomycetaceae bacterium]